MDIAGGPGFFPGFHGVNSSCASRPETILTSAIYTVRQSNFRKGGDALPGVAANQQVSPTFSGNYFWQPL